MLGRRKSPARRQTVSLKQPPLIFSTAHRCIPRAGAVTSDTKNRHVAPNGRRIHRAASCMCVVAAGAAAVLPVLLQSVPRLGELLRGSPAPWSLVVTLVGSLPRVHRGLTHDRNSRRKSRDTGINGESCTTPRRSFGWRRGPVMSRAWHREISVWADVELDIRNASHSFMRPMCWVRLLCRHGTANEDSR